MLTKSDLYQIGKVIDESLEQKLEEKLEQKLKPIKKDLRYLKHTVDIIAKNYDEEDALLKKRVGKIEQHLSLVK